jgi:hypothetical protein
VSLTINLNHGGGVWECGCRGRFHIPSPITSPGEMVLVGAISKGTDYSRRYQDNPYHTVAGSETPVNGTLIVVDQCLRLGPISPLSPNNMRGSLKRSKN